MSSKNILLVILAAISLSSQVASALSQKMPHRVFGTIDDKQGNAVTDIQAEVVYYGDTLASDTTNEEGYYDITVPYGEEYNSEEVQIQVSGSQADSFTYITGEIDEINLTVEISQQKEQASSGSETSERSTIFLSSKEETTSNQTDTTGNITSKGNNTEAAKTQVSIPTPQIAVQKTALQKTPVGANRARAQVIHLQECLQEEPPL